MKFCSLCGKPLGNGTDFCTSCGHKNGQAVQEKRSRSDKSPVTKKKIAGVIVAAIFLIGAVAAHLFLSSLHTPEKAVASFRQAIKSADAKQLADLMNEGQSKVKVTEGEAKEYLLYLEDQADLDEILDGLKDNQSAVEEGHKGEIYKDDNGNKILNIQKTRNYLFVYKKYGIAFYPVEILVSSKFKGADVNVDGKEPVRLEEADTSVSVAHLFPGEHAVEAEIKNDYAIFKNEQELDFSKAADNKLRVEAGIEGEMITVYSNDDRAILFVDGESTGQKVADIDYFGPLLLDSSVKLHAERTVDGKVEKSASVRADDYTATFWFGDERAADPYGETDSYEEEAEAEEELYASEWALEDIDFSDYMASYYNAVVSSVNNGDFAVVSDYFDFESPLYEQQESYTIQLTEAGMQEELLGYEVQSAEEVEGGFKVTVKEEWIFYKQIEESTHEILTADYYIRWVDESLKIYDIQNINKLLQEPL